MSRKKKTKPTYEKLFLCLPCNILLFTRTYFMENPCPKCGGWEFRQIWPWQGERGNLRPLEELEKMI